MSNYKVLFLMTGSIACYKACHVISRLKQSGCDVQVVATPSALQFVGNATLEGLTGNPVVSDLYAMGNVMDHIHLMRWADLILVAPATANFINKAAQGVADDLAQTLFLAHDFKKPFLIAPAMNTSMYSHPATQKSLSTLKDMGVEILETASGILACGEAGWGKLLEPEEILKQALEALQKQTQSPRGLPPPRHKLGPNLKILVTAGGTQEPIDTVRVISNLSSGRTGVAIADFLSQMGLDVTLLRAHGSVKSAHVAQCETFTSFTSLDQKLKSLLASGHFTHVIHSAAVSDYSLESLEVQGQHYLPLEVKKLPSDVDSLSLHLKRNHKIIDRLRSYSGDSSLQIIAFKLTSHASNQEQTSAVEKIFKNSKANYVVHNDLSQIDVIRNRHPFTLFKPDGFVSCDGLERLESELLQVILTKEVL